MTNHNQFRGFTFIVGIDIAKSVFQAYTCNVQTGEITNEQVKRADLLERFADRGKCLIGMEACGSHASSKCSVTRCGSWTPSSSSRSCSTTKVTGPMPKAFSMP